MTDRLLAIAAWVPACDTFYDIGTDHGLLPAFLLKEGRCRFAYPCDISEKSLGKARALFAAEGLAAFARFHLGDGFSGIAPGERDAAAVCGVGARTILSMLPEGLRCPLVLSTHVDPHLLRERLPEKGYLIERERLVREERRYYVVMQVSCADAPRCEGADAYIGRGLAADPLFTDYLAWKEKVARNAAAGGSPLWRERLAWMKEAKTWSAHT